VDILGRVGMRERVELMRHATRRPDRAVDTWRSPPDLSDAADIGDRLLLRA
jgi:hypothetical protein